MSREENNENKFSFLSFYSCKNTEPAQAERPWVPAHLAGKMGVLPSNT